MQYFIYFYLKIVSSCYDSEIGKLLFVGMTISNSNEDTGSFREKKIKKSKREFNVYTEPIIDEHSLHLKII